MLKSCMYRGMELPCSELFTTFPTDQGMCCTFNVRKADEMFKTSEYQKMVDFMQTRDKNMSFIDPKLTNGWYSSVTSLHTYILIYIFFFQILVCTIHCATCLISFSF